MALAVFIDATDGALARAARVKELIPWFDGSLLDNITDYFNYVIVAAFSCCAPIFFHHKTHFGLLACRCSPAPMDFAARTPRPMIIFFSVSPPTGISSRFIYMS